MSAPSARQPLYRGGPGRGGPGAEEAPPPAPRRTRPSTREFVGRVLIVLLLGGIAAGLVLASHALLLLFGAVLFAVILRGLARLLIRLAPRLPDKAAVGIVIVALMTLTGAFLLMFGTQVSQQFDKVAEQIPGGLDRIEAWLKQTDMGRHLLQAAGSGLPTVGGDENAPGPGGSATEAVGWIVRRAGQALQALANGLAGLVVVFFGGLFLALQPGLYRTGIEKMVPQDWEEPVDRALDRTGGALWLWAAGQLVEMVAIGVLTGLGLWLLGVPAPLALGIIAGVLEFIPFAGPILAAIPAILLALTVSPALALATAVFYLVLQQIEGNLILPLIQRRAVSLPPVVAIFAILVAGALFGAIGVLFAVPLAVAAMTLVQELYVKEGLGRDVRPQGGP